MTSVTTYLSKLSKEERLLLYVSLIVVAAHLIFTFFALFTETPEKIVKKTPLVVKTVRLKENASTSGSISSEPRPSEPRPTVKEVQPSTPTPLKKPTAKKEPPPVKKEVIKQGKTPVKKETLKQEKPKPKEVVKEAQVSRVQESINKAKESMEKIGKNTSGKDAPSAKESKIALLSILNADAFQESHLQGEVDYQDELVYTLKENLKLPENGKVDITLTLSSKGEVLELHIEQSRSALNRGYVEREIPRLKFAPFKGSFAKKSNFIFNITLTSD